MTREQLDQFNEAVKYHFGDDKTAMNAAHFGLMWAETKVDDKEIEALRAENERLKNEFFRMQGENMGLNITIDELRSKNAEPA